MTGRDGGRVAAAALALAIVRLFLFFVAPGWAAHVAARSIAGAIYMPPK